VTPDLTDLTDQLTLTPDQALGIPFALVGAVLLSLGAQFQHRGVNKVEDQTPGVTTGGLSVRQLVALLSRPSWVFGTIFLGLAIVFQLISLRLAPLIVVQPLGAIALVITAIVNARVSRVRLDRESIRAIIFCVAGIGLFVTVAAFTAVERPIDERQLITVLVILGVVLAGLGSAFLFFRHRIKAIFYIVAAGMLYGFVATLAKVVINRIVADNFEWLTVVCIAALLLATALGGYFVQSAYSSGPPDLVIAGLTVIDPLVAVLIGVIVLGEAAAAPWYAGILFLVAGALAIFGVFQLSKHHPQMQR
jgi:drug/metabolite transporter (DMT)-like permease